MLRLIYPNAVNGVGCMTATVSLPYMMHSLQRIVMHSMQPVRAIAEEIHSISLRTDYLTPRQESCEFPERQIIGLVIEISHRF